MKYAKIMIARMNELHMTKQQLSDLSGIPYMTVSGMLKNGAAKAGLQNVLAVCGALGIDPNLFAELNEEVTTATPWHHPLATAYEAAEVPRREAACDVLRIPYVDPGKPAAVPPAHEKTDEKIIKLPTASTLAEEIEEPTDEEMIVFDYPSAAGMPLYVEADYERIKFPHLAVPSKADFGVRIEGDSMEPEIRDGDIVWVYKTPEIGDGQIGIFQLSDGAVCKRARMHPSGRLIGLESINAKYEVITGNRLIGVRCVGRVLRRYDPNEYHQ